MLLADGRVRSRHPRRDDERTCDSWGEESTSISPLYVSGCVAASCVKRPSDSEQWEVTVTVQVRTALFGRLPINSAPKRVVRVDAGRDSDIRRCLTFRTWSQWL